MSIAAISANSYANYAQQSIQSQFKQFQQEFQQLGSDLQSSNVKAAQQDLSALQQLSPQGNSTSSAQSNNPVALEFSQLGQALQSGNIASAQQDFSNVQQAFQNKTSSSSQAGEAHHAHHHHHAGGVSGSSDSSPTGSNLVGQSFTTLGQYSPSNNLAAAQQAYTGFQNFQEFGTTVPIETSPLLIGPTVSLAA